MARQVHPNLVLAVDFGDGLHDGLNILALDMAGYVLLHRPISDHCTVPARPPAPTMKVARGMFLLLSSAEPDASSIRLPIRSPPTARASPLGNVG